MKKIYIKPYTTVVIVDLDSSINSCSELTTQQRSIGDGDDDIYEGEGWGSDDDEDVWGD